MSIKVSELYTFLDEMIPKSLSCEWDNDGLMVCGDENAFVNKILFTLDVTDGAIEYAKENKCDVIISHHPLIFRPIKSLNERDITSRRVINALMSGISVMSFHTRLDAVSGGVNDVICDILNISDREKFGPLGEEMGRIGNLPQTDLASFTEKIKTSLGTKGVVVTDCGKEVHRVAFLGGDGKDYVRSAVMSGADTFVTGRCGYNVDIDACDMGINIIEAGHYTTEAPVLSRLREWIEGRFAGLSFDFYYSNKTEIM